MNKAVVVLLVMSFSVAWFVICSILTDDNEENDSLIVRILGALLNYSFRVVGLLASVVRLFTSGISFGKNVLPDPSILAGKIQDIYNYLPDPEVYINTARSAAQVGRHVIDDTSSYVDDAISDVTSDVMSRASDISDQAATYTTDVVVQACDYASDHLPRITDATLEYIQQLRDQLRPVTSQSNRLRPPFFDLYLWCRRKIIHAVAWIQFLPYVLPLNVMISIAAFTLSGLLVMYVMYRFMSFHRPIQIEFGPDIAVAAEDKRHIASRVGPFQPTTVCGVTIDGVIMVVNKTFVHYMLSANPFVMPLDDIRRAYATEKYSPFSETARLQYSEDTCH